MVNTPPEDKVSFQASENFVSFLEKLNGSISLTAPKQSKLFFLGQKDGALKIFDRTIEDCRAISVCGKDLYLAGHREIWQFSNIHIENTQASAFDALFVPRRSWITGDVDIHDIYVHQGITPLFVNTLFSSISTLDDEYNFKLIWKPEFVSRIMPEDRCHLTGMAVDPERKIPRYATVLAQTDSYEEWRLDYPHSGALLDVVTGEVLCDGLSVPYSPRIHNGQLYCLEAGRGALIKIDLKTKKKEDICFVPGFARGLSFVGNYALIGCSKPRPNKPFDGLELEKRLRKERQEPCCGVYVLNLDSGKLDHYLRIDGTIFTDIYDVKFLDGLSMPSLVGFKGSELDKIFYLNPAEG